MSQLSVPIKPESDHVEAEEQSGIIVQRANEQDIMDLITFSREVHEESYFSKVDFSEDKAKSIF